MSGGYHISGKKIETYYFRGVLEVRPEKLNSYSMSRSQSVARLGEGPLQYSVFRLNPIRNRWGQFTSTALIAKYLIRHFI